MEHVAWVGDSHLRRPLAGRGGILNFCIDGMGCRAAVRILQTVLSKTAALEQVVVSLGANDDELAFVAPKLKALAKSHPLVNFYFLEVFAPSHRMKVAHLSSLLEIGNVHILDTEQLLQVPADELKPEHDIHMKAEYYNVFVAALLRRIKVQHKPGRAGVCKRAPTSAGQRVRARLRDGRKLRSGRFVHG